MTVAELRALLLTFLDETDTRTRQCWDDPAFIESIARATTAAEVEAIIRAKFEPLTQKIRERAEELSAQTRGRLAPT